MIFGMALELSGSANSAKSSSRSELYESYFRRLLRVEKNDVGWAGWRTVLELVASWSLLDTGYHRGQSLSHTRLFRRMVEPSAGGGLSLVEECIQSYDLPITTPHSLLSILRAAGILQYDNARTWRFGHDTYAEFFAASRILSLLDSGDSVDLSPWSRNDEKQQAFVDVLQFVREIGDRQSRERLLCDKIYSSKLARKVVNRINSFTPPFSISMIRLAIAKTAVG
jgi:hypothetical protein